MIASLPPVHLTGSSPEHACRTTYGSWAVDREPGRRPLRPGGDVGVAHVEREPASGVIASAAPLRRPSTRIPVNTEAVASPTSFSSSKAYSTSFGDVSSTLPVAPNLSLRWTEGSPLELRPRAMRPAPCSRAGRPAPASGGGWVDPDAIEDRIWPLRSIASPYGLEAGTRRPAGHRRR